MLHRPNVRRNQPIEAQKPRTPKLTSAALRLALAREEEALLDEVVLTARFLLPPDPCLMMCISRAANIRGGVLATTAMARTAAMVDAAVW